MNEPQQQQEQLPLADKLQEQFKQLRSTSPSVPIEEVGGEQSQPIPSEMRQKAMQRAQAKYGSIHDPASKSPLMSEFPTTEKDDQSQQAQSSIDTEQGRQQAQQFTFEKSGQQATQSQQTPSEQYQPFTTTEQSSQAQPEQEQQQPPQAQQSDQSPPSLFEKQSSQQQYQQYQQAFAVEQLGQQPQAGQTAENWVPQPQTFRSGKQRIHLEQALGADIRQRMLSTPAKAIAPNLRQVLFARSSDSIASVIYKLTSSGIISVPLLQESQQHFDTFIDMLDILSYLVESAGLKENTDNLKQLDWDKRMQLFEATPCSELLKTRAGRHPWYTVHRDTSLQQIINFLVTKKTHRMVLTDDKGQFSSVITQHRVIKWLSNRKLEEFGDFGGLTIDDLDLGLKPVVCVDYFTRVIDAMMLMYEKGVSGVGVLGPKNELIGNISLSDLKDIGEAAQWYAKLFMTCQNFNSIKREGAGLPPLVFSTPKAMLKDVLAKFANNFIHRVYIVEKGSHKPLGVVTCSDILNLFAKTPSTALPQ